jgi:hypothetical protein
MHVEVARILTAWLKHETYGVNAMIDQVDRWTGYYEDDGTTQILDPRPADVDIYNDIDTKEIQSTSGIRPPTMPSLVIVVDANPKTIDIAQVHKSGHEISAAAGFGYYAEQTDIGTEIIAGDYVLRALTKSLVRFNQPQLSRPFLRELNGILLARITGYETQRVASAVPESWLLGILFADLQILDKSP